MPLPSYSVGIDLGTTYSAAAVYRSGEPKPEVLPLGEQTSAVASMVFLAPDGSMLCGAAAHRRAVTDPRRVVREFKRRIGDATPLVVGGTPVSAEEVAARFIEWILERVAQREGGPAAHVALTHPAEWGPHKQAAVHTALAERGISVRMLSEPEAAAIGYASTERVDAGGTVAVYDLGGGTFDAAVVRKLAGGGFAVAGKPVGIERLGGVDFDELVFEHVRAGIGAAWARLDPHDPAVHTAVAGLRRECTAAKEALSADTEVMIPVMLPGSHTQVRMGRAEFEEQIRPAVADTVEALRRALAAAGVAPEALSAVLMVGGSSRIPLITQLVSAELGRPVAVDADPKSVIALGAAVAAHLDTATEVTGDATVAARTATVAPPADPESTVSFAAVRPPVAPASTVTPPQLGVRTRGDAVLGRPGGRRRRALTAAAGVGLAASFVAGVAWLSGPEQDPARVANVAGAAPPPDSLLPGQGTPIELWASQPSTESPVADPQQPVVLAAASQSGDRAAGTPTRRRATQVPTTVAPTTTAPSTTAPVATTTADDAEPTTDSSTSSSDTPDPSPSSSSSSTGTSTPSTTEPDSSDD